MSNYDTPKAKEPVDYTGVKIGILLLPIFFLLVFLGNADLGATVCIVLAAMIFAIKIRWNLRKHVWFWVIILFIFALHVPLFFIVRWPQGSLPTLFYTMPFGIVDFLIISKALGLAEKFLSKDSS